MLWEALVTEGHVRAARFRFVAIPLAILGILFVYWADPPDGLFFRWRPLNVAGLGQDYHTRAAQPVLERFAPVRPVSASADEMKQLAPSSELAEVYKDILEGLNAHDAAPAALPIKDADADSFWKFGWPLTDIVRLKQRDIQAFGATVMPPARPYGGPAAPVRWLAVFRKDDGKWHGTTVAYGTAFIAVPGLPSTAPDFIPVTLRSAMNIEEFKP